MKIDLFVVGRAHPEDTQEFHVDLYLAKRAAEAKSRRWPGPLTLGKLRTDLPASDAKLAKLLNRAQGEIEFDEVVARFEKGMEMPRETAA